MYKAIRKAMQGRVELLNDNDCGDVWGLVYLTGTDVSEFDLCELVRVVYIDGVPLFVPTDAADLSPYEWSHVLDAGYNVAEDMREAEAEDNGYDG